MRLKELLRRDRSFRNEDEYECGRKWSYRLKLGWVGALGGGLVLVAAGAAVLTQINQAGAGAAMLAVGVVLFAAGVPLFFLHNRVSVRVRHYERSNREGGA